MAEAGRGRWAAYAAFEWMAFFAFVHLYWLLGGTFGLPPGQKLWDNTPLLVIDIVSIPLCIGGAGVAWALDARRNPVRGRGALASTSAHRHLAAVDQNVIGNLRHACWAVRRPHCGMPNIDVDDDLVGWLTPRPELAAGLSGFSSAVYDSSRLPLREREVARIRIAEVNECELCRNTRDALGTAAGVDEDLYDHILEWRSWPGYTDRERLVAEFAERFAIDHVALRTDAAFWTRLRSAFTDAEIVDLALCCAMWLGSGRAMRVLDVGQACSLVLHAD